MTDFEQHVAALKSDIEFHSRMAREFAAEAAKINRDTDRAYWARAESARSFHAGRARIARRNLRSLPSIS